MSFSLSRKIDFSTFNNIFKKGIETFLFEKMFLGLFFLNIKYNFSHSNRIFCFCFSLFFSHFFSCYFQFDSIADTFSRTSCLSSQISHILNFALFGYPSLAHSLCIVLRLVFVVYSHFATLVVPHTHHLSDRDDCARKVVSF